MAGSVAEFADSPRLIIAPRRWDLGVLAMLAAIGLYLAGFFGYHAIQGSVVRGVVAPLIACGVALICFALHSHLKMARAFARLRSELADQPADPLVDCARRSWWLNDAALSRRIAEVAAATSATSASGAVIVVRGIVPQVAGLVGPHYPHEPLCGLRRKSMKPASIWVAALVVAICISRLGLPSTQFIMSRALPTALLISLAASLGYWFRHLGARAWFAPGLVAIESRRVFSGSPGAPRFYPMTPGTVAILSVMALRQGESPPGVICGHRPVLTLYAEGRSDSVPLDAIGWQAALSALTSPIRTDPALMMAEFLAP